MPEGLCREAMNPKVPQRIIADQIDKRVTILFLQPQGQENPGTDHLPPPDEGGDFRVVGRSLGVSH